MRAGGGKQKGASFEREACVMLSRWITDNVRDDVFWRSAMSGGRATVAHKRGSRDLSSQVGDISCIDPVGSLFIGNFAVECKFYKKLDYEGIVLGRGKLLSFWAEINKQARQHNKHPFLICRQNRMQTHVCFDKAGMRKLGLHDYQMLAIGVVNNIFIMSAREFVESCKPFR